MTVITGHAISSFRQHGTHLCKVKQKGNSLTEDWNDDVEVICSHNLAAGDDVPGALREMSAVAAGSRCERFLYAGSINPDRADGTELTPTEAENAAWKLLNTLGFTRDHQWLLIRHKKKRRYHYHVCANRVDPVLLKAVDLSWNYPKHEQVARSLETLFSLKPTRGAFTGRKKGKDGRFLDERPIGLMNMQESQQEKRTEIAVATVIRDLCQVWESILTLPELDAKGGGKEFADRLRATGYILARGDRRDMVVLDCMGGTHNPARRLGLKAAEFRKAMRDLDSSRLPTVDAVRDQLKRLACAESDLDGPQVPALPDRVSVSNTPERNGTSMQGKLQ